MKLINLENYRCFHKKQVAPLAPLTLLVGENSTGKTSFLAIIRILWDSVYGHGDLNFKEPPFDLGSFEQISHRQSEKSGPAPTFEAGFRANQSFDANFEFNDYRSLPRVVNMRLTDGDTCSEIYYDNGNLKMQVSTVRGAWTVSMKNSSLGRQIPLSPPRHLLSLTIPDVLYHLIYRGRPNYSGKYIPVGDSPTFSKKDARSISNANFAVADFSEERPFVSAPVRSRPQRTYDQASWMSDPEGYYAPMLMANLASFEEEAWEHLKYELERFGSSAGIFDEIDIKRLGRSGSDPFQVQVRKIGKKRKGPKQNLIDVGYGISQVLPILTELLLPKKSGMALLQQPEVHLHPSAQAALGTLFCEIASKGRQLIIETHSDFMIDRIRMDVRDQKTNLKPEDVSILFFERNDTSVQIHSIQIDELGNVLNAPDSYGSFFMEETSRSLGF
ncbi:MAG: DUF3696 domain-containing protein [Bacteroidetes bacterium]|nr:DUF3696 domain-containing protein [Bacteroidota bacterium]MDE2672731.1 DUF3696 domain-containing protein [Bacteroidota bacterium]